MIDNANKDELIEQYLRGEISGGLLDEFKEKLASDDQFRKEVALQKAIIQNIKAVGRKEWALKLKNIHNEIDFRNAEDQPVMPNAGKIKRLNPFYKKKYIFAVAAAIIVILFSTLFIVTINSGPNAEHIFLANYQPYPDLEPGTRALAPGVPSEKKEAFKAYNEGNYLESIRLFNNILRKEEDEIVLFYLGNAYLSAGKPGEAESTFKKYLNKYKEFASESKWYLSLSYLKQGKLGNSRKLLEELAKENNNSSKKAREILSKW